MSNYDFELDMSTRNSLSLIISRITKNSTILEFGPANGRMTKHLKEILGCTVYAVELDEESAKGAAEFCEEILVGDIEKFTWLTKYQDIEFDYIIFADVLEHLYDPGTVLTKAKTLLKNEGSILMSLPNIAHNAIIMDLLNDKFTYRKTGLLDSTHIRFFTKNTLEELIENSGLQIAFETASYAAPPDTEFKNNYADLDRSVALLLSGREFGEAYQFVFEAKNNVTNFKTDFLQEDLASLYVDTGNGFNELEKIATIFNSQSDNVINFTLDTDIHNVKAIRIDPLEMALSLKVENIIVNATDETNKLKHNGVTTGNNELVFLDNDPQLLIDFDESVILKNVAVKYEYLTKNHTEKIELQAQVVKDQARQIQEKDTHIENQAQQIQSLRLKNRIKRLFGFYQPTSLFRKELPNNFSKHFDSKGYLKANPDVATEIDEGTIKSGLVHFCNSGFDEVLKGDRKLLESLPFYDDENYKSIRTDVTQAIDEGSFIYSHYVHYLLHGHKELQKQISQKDSKMVREKILKGVTDSNKLKLAIAVYRTQGLQGVLKKIKQHTKPSHGMKVLTPSKIVRDVSGVYSLSTGDKVNEYTYIEEQCPSDYTPPTENAYSTILFSIVVPVYNISSELLNALLGSILKQWYPYWELILVDDASSLKDTHNALSKIDDPRIRVLKLENNSGISEATNKGLDLAKGDYIIFADHDDELTSDCLYELEKCIKKENPDFIYSDEDKIAENGKFVQPHFKPDWSPDTMMSTMFTGHISCFKHSLLKKVGRLRSQFDGCQDWDFVLRFTENTTRISHIQKVLYHWRIIPNSIASDLAAKPYVLEASKKVREDALKRRNLVATIEPLPQIEGYFRANYHLKGSPLISIIIPTRDNTLVLQKCIDSIKKITSYSHYEIIIIDNGSINSSAISYFQELTKEKNINIIRHAFPFNYSELNNIGAQAANGDILLFLNDDTEVLQQDWLDRLGGYSQLSHVGAVGAKLMYSGGKQIQHAGVLNLENGPGHAFLKQETDIPGYYMRNLLEYNWLAVTGACLMVMKNRFVSIGGFSEDLPVAYNDIDLCMRLNDAGFYNVVCQAVRLIHYESVSRGADDIEPEKIARLEKDKECLFDRNPRYFQKDPFYNSNLHPNGINFEGVM